METRIHHASDDERVQPQFNAQTLERETGIEPASSAWKAGVLPLNYSRFEARDPQKKPRKISNLPTCLLPLLLATSSCHFFATLFKHLPTFPLVEEVGFEPT